ncbi:MAG: hypothetical protein WC406_03535 [Methanoregula sp.]
MNLHFCTQYKGDGYSPTNRYCRNCPHSHIACDPLWHLVLRLAQSGNGQPVDVCETNAVLFPNLNNRDFVKLRVNVSWNLSKEDFLHFIATGHARMGRADQRLDPETSPSLTRQEPYVQAILAMLGGVDIPEVRAAKQVQQQHLSIPVRSKTFREEIVEKLEAEKRRLGSDTSPEAFFRRDLLNQMTKMIYEGKSKSEILDWFNKKSRSSGADMRPIVSEIYRIILDYSF